MSLAPGLRLGAYEIVAPVGAGGMGEVYRARDTRLDRTVAIKVLTGALAADSDARRRFEHEARAIAALNDPHICTIHDVGRHEALDYLVLEYLEGETLADRLSRMRICPCRCSRLTLRPAPTSSASSRSTRYLATDGSCSTPPSKAASAPIVVSVNWMKPLAK